MYIHLQSCNTCIPIIYMYVHTWSAVLSVLQAGRISKATLPLRLFQWLVMPRSLSIRTSSEMLPHWPFPSTNMGLKAVVIMERKWQPMTSRRWLTTGVVGIFGRWSAHLHSEWGLKLVQEFGRAGRDGCQCTGTVFFHERDLQNAAFWCKSKQSTERQSDILQEFQSSWKWVTT